MNVSWLGSPRDRKRAEQNSCRRANQYSEQIGGSLAGLFSGIALKNAGHNVHILEQDYDERESHMAGVCLGRDASDFLARHDRIAEPFSHESKRVQLLQPDNTVREFYNTNRNITSWDTLYFRLRANYDGYKSTYYGNSPLPEAAGGEVTYQCRTHVLKLERSPSAKYTQDERIILTVQNRDTKDTTNIEADLVIAADGPNSFVRTTYLPQVKRQYVGYIAWRGTVLESEVSKATRAIFDKHATVTRMHRHHCIMYSIPGEAGTLEPGKRLLNFVWYTNETPEQLESIMTDAVDGHIHRHVVPAGRLRQDIWDAQVRKAEGVPLALPFLEVVQAIRNPFVQVITEFCTPQAVFEDGRVLLVGDSLSLYRPHTAFSCTQASFHALNLEQYVLGKLSLRRWEERVLRYGRLHWLQSLFWGEMYQQHPIVMLMGGLRYWTCCAVDIMKSWWYREERLLRL